MQLAKSAMEQLNRATKEPNRSELHEILHVQPTGGIWEVYHLFQMYRRLFVTQEQAMSYANDVALETRPLEVVVHANDGSEVKRIRFE